MRFIWVFVFLFLVSCSDKESSDQQFDLGGKSFSGIAKANCKEQAGSEGRCNSGRFYFLSKDEVLFFLPGSDMGFASPYIVIGNMILIDDPYVDFDLVLLISESGDQLSGTNLGPFYLNESQ